MTFNKKIAKTLVFALGFGAISLLGVNSAKAAQAAAPTAITFKGKTENLTANGAKFWGVAKEVNEKKANLTVNGKTYFVSDVKAYPATGTTGIDLSAFDKRKKTILAIGGVESLEDGTKWAIEEIAPQVKTLKAIYMPTNEQADAKALGDASVGFLKVMNGEAAMTLTSDNEKIEVKKGFGKWQTLKDFTGGSTDATKIKEKLEVLTQRGALLTFRLAGSDKTDDAAGAWASAETKLKIPAKPAAPKVKVDAIKEVVSLKDGQEYQVTKGTAGNWTAAESKKHTFEEMQIDKTKDNTLKVRTKANGKKLLSKEVTLTLKKQDAPTLQTLTAQGGNLITPADGKGVDVLLKVPYDIRKGAEIINGSAVDYEFYYGTEAPTAETKWTKLAAGKQADKKRKAKPTKASLKYSAEKKPGTYSDVNTGAKLYVRLAGGKQLGNEVLMPSAAAEKDFVIANQEQVATISGNNAAEGAEKNYTSAVANAKGGVTLKYGVSITNVFGTKATLRAKVKGASGISVKGSKVKVTLEGTNRTGTGTATIEVKVSKNAFRGKEGSTVVADVEYSVQSVKKNLKITFTVPAK